MNLEKFESIFTLIVLGFMGFIIHKLLFYFFVPKNYETDFVYPISLLYFFFFLFSTLLILILDKVKQKNINSVGFTFLFLTTFKMVVAYVFLKPILTLNLPKTPIEKMSFFIIFVYFLAIETLVTIRILNNKQ